MKHKKANIFWLVFTLSMATIGIAVNCSKEKPEKAEPRIEVDSSLLIINDNFIIE